MTERAKRPAGAKSPAELARFDADFPGWRTPVPDETAEHFGWPGEPEPPRRPPSTNLYEELDD